MSPWGKTVSAVCPTQRFHLIFFDDGRYCSYGKSDGDCRRCGGKTHGPHRRHSLNKGIHDRSFAIIGTALFSCSAPPLKFSVIMVDTPVMEKVMAIAGEQRYRSFYPTHRFPLIFCDNGRYCSYGKNDGDCRRCGCQIPGHHRSHRFGALRAPFHLQRAVLF